MASSAAAPSLALLAGVHPSLPASCALSLNGISSVIPTQSNLLVTCSSADRNDASGFERTIGRGGHLERLGERVTPAA